MKPSARSCRGMVLAFLCALHGIAAAAAAPLVDAADRDDLAAVKALLEAGADASAGNRYHISPLMLACGNGNAEMVRMLLAAGANPHAEGPGGETLLMTAARTGRVECVSALLAAGVGVDAVERRGQTALMWAAAAGHTEVVDALLAAGADFRAAAPSGFTALFFAVREGRIGAVRSLVKAGADVNATVVPAPPLAGRTVQSWRGDGDAAAAPRLTVRLPGSGDALGGPGPPKGRMMRNGTAPLLLAVENGHFELALELVAAGADPDDQRSGFTPLHAVTWARRTPSGDGDDGQPPPAGSGSVSSLEFVREFVRRGADVNARCREGSGNGGNLNTKGVTPFLLAAQTEDLALLKVLVELGADPAISNADGCTPLLAAAGVGVTAPGEEPGTEAEALATVNWLLDNGADINATDQRGETVMHGAAYKLMPALVKLLDTRGADISQWNRKNKKGWTPLLIAQGYRYGNFRPVAEMEAVISDVMKAHGTDPPPAPSRE